MKTYTTEERCINAVHRILTAGNLPGALRTLGQKEIRLLRQIASLTDLTKPIPQTRSSVPARCGKFQETFEVDNATIANILETQKQITSEPLFPIGGGRAYLRHLTKCPVCQIRLFAHRLEVIRFAAARQNGDEKVRNETAAITAMLRRAGIRFERNRIVTPKPS